MSAVTIKAGHWKGGTVTLECFDQDGDSLGIDSLASMSTLQPLSVSAFGIRRCELSFTGEVAVFDDLSWEPLPPCLTHDFETEDDLATPTPARAASSVGDGRRPMRNS